MTRRVERWSAWRLGVPLVFDRVALLHTEGEVRFRAHCDGVVQDQRDSSV